MFEFILLGSSCLVVYGLTLAVYRILFHPLAKFPGPKWSAASYWYEFYYEIIQPGSWLWQIEKLHEKYGMLEESVDHNGLMLTASHRTDRANQP